MKDLMNPFMLKQQIPRFVPFHIDRARVITGQDPNYPKSLVSLGGTALLIGCADGGHLLSQIANGSRKSRNSIEGS
jgi:hypothetical protein